MPRGIVKWFDVTKGYGFIVPDEAGSDVFVHASAVETTNADVPLLANDRVEYTTGRDERSGRERAFGVRVLASAS